MSRTNRIIRGVTIGYGYQAIVAMTGLVLTPFLIRRLSVENYGLWLIVVQTLGFLGLLDLGVSAILPREIAGATGASNATMMTELVHRAGWLVWLQTPVVLLVAGGTWVAVTLYRPELGGPLGVILFGFVVQFPLRLSLAILNGLQDLSFCGIVQAAAWFLTTVVSVALVFAGCGLYALAIGWTCGQMFLCFASRWRLRKMRPALRVERSWPGRRALAMFLRPSFWTSSLQLAHVLVWGMDLIVLGWILGPAAVVVYSCTGKLVSYVNNQPYFLAVLASPALSELRAEGDNRRLRQAFAAFGLTLLLVSGALGLAVLAVNAVFVRIWVGPDQYGGPTLTLLLVLSMVARHCHFTWAQAALAFGCERVLALAAMAGGLITLVAIATWTAALGSPIGLPLGTLTGLLTTDAPVGFFAVAAAIKATPTEVLSWASPWAVRFVLIAAPLIAMSYTQWAGKLWVAGGLLVGSIAMYAFTVLCLLTQEPLCPYAEGTVAFIRRRLPWLIRITDMRKQQ